MKDKRGIGILGMIVALVGAWLIISAILLVVVYGPGIANQIGKSLSGVTSIGDINLHPQNYVGKEVTVEGFGTAVQRFHADEHLNLVYDNIWDIHIVDADLLSGAMIYAKTTTLPSICYTSLTKCRFTGILQYDNVTVYNTTALCIELSTIAQV